MSAKKKCCCNVTVGPCDCSPGAPWVAGRGTSVRLRCAFSGISPSSPSVGWGAVNYEPSVATVTQRWYGSTATLLPRPTFCDGGPSFCDYRTSIYNEGTTWAVSGSAVSGNSDPLPRNVAACGTAFAYGFANGPVAIPDFGTVISKTVNSFVSAALYYDVSTNRTYIDVLARSTVSATVSFDELNYQAPFDPCDPVADGVIPRTYDIMSTVNNSTKQFVWFKHQANFAGKPCPSASYVLSNQAVAHTPAYVDSCGLGYGGLIRCCSSGTATLSLINA